MRGAPDIALSPVATMSNSIVEDLAKKGIEAERLPASSPLPREGLAGSDDTIQYHQTSDPSPDADG